MSDGSPPPSICFIRAAESYPKSQMEKEDSQLLVPFQELPGESIKYLGRTDDGILALSNYRIFLSKKSTAFETYVPLGLIESVQVRDPFQLIVNCKDASTVRCSFQSTEQCVDWQRRIHLLIGVPQTLETLFAFGFYSWTSDIFGNSNENASTNGYKGKDRFAQLTNPAGAQALLNVEAVPLASCRLQRDISYDSDFKNEVARLGFDLKGSWRVSMANADFKLCPSYPPRLLVPFCITDEMLHNVANFRGSRRLPAVVWRHQKSGAILARCSQPEVGWLGWRNTKDEQLLKALTDACAFDRGEHARRSTLAHASALQPTDARELNGQSSSSGKSSPSIEDSSHEELTLDEIRKILIVDARSYTSAVTNRARGGGCECIEYYPCAEIEFMNLGNIHAIRKSFHAVRQLCASSPDDPNWFGQLEKTMWMQHLSGLLGAAMTVVHTIEKNGRPVLVHCSDGWDRTPQIVATAQLCLDPYYRTVEGFRVLVEREWLNFGHKFADRSGNGPHSDEVNERCPVFLQWLDLVHQIQRQYPCCFEFSGGYLIKMAQHSLSCLFGTFLCNSLKERLDNSIFDRTFSVWPFLADTMYRNPLYKHETEKVLWPAHSVRFLHFWSDLYLGSLANKNGIDLPQLSNERSNVHQGLMAKARSSENLTTNELGQSTRRSSDPNLAVESIITECLNINSNSMFDLRSEADNSVRENVQYDVKNSKDLEVDVTDANKKGRICVQNNFSETHNYQSKASKRDIINVTTPLPAQSSIMCSRDQIKRSESNVPALRYSGNDQSPPSNDKKRSDKSPAFWQSQCDVSSNILILGMPTRKIEGKSKTRNLDLESYRKNIDAASETQSSKINLSFNILPKVHLKPNVGQRLTTDYAFPHHLDLHVPRETAGIVYKREQHSLPKNESINGSALAANSKHFEESQYTTSERTAGKSSFVCSSGARVRRNTFGSSYNRDIGHLKITAESGGGSGNHVTSYGLMSLPPTPQNNQERVQFTIPCPDGLAHGLSEQNIRLYQIVQEHKLREETLLREIHSMRLALLEKGCPSCNSIVSANMEHENGSDIVENASTCSWEAVEERSGPPSFIPTLNQEKKPSSVLWVPDHAVSRCSSCQTEFWLGRRRHHCRSCGEIFCADCSEYWAPLPYEKLFNPVRLCGSCYTIVTTDVHGNAAVSLDHGALNEATQCSANT
ncbi:hypothetical protein KR074_004118 [Drosophila pseudoananassae]|nr:hypothetical protein KR074_004118 [Drosophila pseudoananassae]